MFNLFSNCIFLKMTHIYNNMFYIVLFVLLDRFFVTKSNKGGSRTVAAHVEKLQSDSSTSEALPQVWWKKFIWFAFYWRRKEIVLFFICMFVHFYPLWIPRRHPYQLCPDYFSITATLEYCIRKHGEGVSRSCIMAKNTIIII